jgi:hypothetical protein
MTHPAHTRGLAVLHLDFLISLLSPSFLLRFGAFVLRYVTPPLVQVEFLLVNRGPIYGGIIAARIVAALELPIAPHDTLLTPQRLDLAAMKLHHFVTANSCAGKLVYRMLFTDGEEREVPLPLLSLFSIDNMPWSRMKEELDERLRVLGFNVQHGIVDQEEEEEPAYHFTTYHSGASSSSYQDDGASSSHYGGATSWPSWPSWD